MNNIEFTSLAQDTNAIEFISLAQRADETLEFASVDALVDLTDDLVEA